MSFKVSLYLLILFFQNYLFAGLAPETLIQTPTGLVCLQKLAIDSLVVSAVSKSLITGLGQSTNQILHVKYASCQKHLKIILKQDSLLVSYNQRFYVPAKHNWLAACDLRTGDCLLDIHGNWVAIKKL